MEQKITLVYIMVSVICLSITFIGISYCIGYVKGFKKSKEIDDKIIEELINKYRQNSV